MADLPESDVTFSVIGAAMEVHRLLGPGFLELVYQRAVEAELRIRGIPWESQKRISVEYKGECLGDHVLDLVVDGRVVVELKAVKDFNEQHQAQLLSYLKATGLSVGLLINFSKSSLDYKRVVSRDGLALPPNPFNPKIR